MNNKLALRPLRHIPDAERAQIALTVLDRYIAGEQVANIAPEYNTSDVTIYALLLREHQDAWKDIQTARALARLEKAQDKLDDVTLDALSLARTREQVRSAQWELERLLKRLYSTSSEVTGKDGGPITIEIVQFGSRTIDSEATVIAEQQIAQITGNSK